MHTDHARCYRAVQAKDPRFDGWFVTAVRTTGIYCRPSCPAVTPRSGNVSFHPTAAAAQRAGYRACKRCRPDASPGSPEWDLRADVTARAVRLIADGVVDRQGVRGLASALGYSTRQVERHLRAELGAGPLALARAHRAQTARTLIETSNLPFGDVAFAAGFGSIRSFNDTVRSIFDLPPSELRRRAARSHPTEAAPGVISLRLPFRRPFAPEGVIGHLVATAVPGVEEWRDGSYRRTLGLPHGHGTVRLTPRTDHVACQLRLTDLRDLTAAVGRCRRLLDLDADPEAVDAALSADPHIGHLVRATPGRRVPRAVDAEELAIRAVLGQQVSTAAARTVAGRLVAAHGTAVVDVDGELTSLFPSAVRLAEVDPATFGLPRTRAAALHDLVRALAAGDLDLGPGADRAAARAGLLDLPGIGPWTVEIIAMRGLGDPDAFPITDLGVKIAAEQLGLPGSPSRLLAAAERWQPWRAYAVQHLWGSLDHAINSLPSTVGTDAGAAA
ncbi:AlkA N-terminal domain-containing protein [Nitriliruptor sp.]|uniref:AlkA N-terminal domain-containing protein n=1 Tax=Nitriliruptor sp. TaxID=2448056 RepID=UPI0034A04B6C